MWEWLVVIVFILFVILKARKRKYFWKAKDGKELSFKEFMQRWKIGIDGITPKQQRFSQLLGTWIIITGIVSGIIVNALVRMENIWWWVEIILVGSLIITVMQLIGTYQAYKRFKQIEESQKQIENNNRSKSRNR